MFQRNWQHPGIAVGLMALAAVFAGTAFGTVFETAALNPAFEAWLGQKDIVPEAYKLGYIPPPVDWSHLRPQPVKQAIPPNFDWRDVGLTPVKDQGICGACWAFAACAGVESWLRINENETWDFSENHLKNHHGFVPGHCDGGNSDMSTAYLARWSGPINESDDPYNPFSSTPPPPDAQVQKLLQSAPIFTATGVIRAEMQAAIMEHGPLATDMTWNELFYNPETNTYYYTGTAAVNHMITVVGWDDSIQTGAVAPGVWICRNSWGEDFGEDGYFYISYYDSRAVKEARGFIDLAAPDAFDRIYQYDDLGLVAFFGNTLNSYAYAANVFTAEVDEHITAVGTYAVANNVAYEITVYNSGITGGQVANPATSTSGVFTHAGYYVVDLPENVAVTAGEDFSVVVRYEATSFDWPVPLEVFADGYAVPTGSPGQSYVSDFGTLFEDLHSVGEEYLGANVCIKAIAGFREIPPPEPSVRIVGRPRVEVGSHTVLTGVVEHLEATSYVWLKDGALLPEVQGPEYTIFEVDESHAGAYVLRVFTEDKAVFESAPFHLQVFPEGSLPLSGFFVILLSAFALAGAGAMRAGSMAARPRGRSV